MSFKNWLSTYARSSTEPKPQVHLEPNKWKDIRLFISSSFIDTHGERDMITRHIIPSANRRLASKFIRIIPVDLRWGVLAKESKDCAAIQKTCLNLVEACKDNNDEAPWFLGLRTDRYGWVQNEYQESKGFNHPEQFKWLDSLKDSGNHVSITSLECLHAVLSATSTTIKPKVLMYERTITNPQDIEPHLKWVFDFECVPEDQKLDESIAKQYRRTPFSSTYEKNRNELNEYLRSNCNVTYRTYNCSYEPGCAVITKVLDDGKCFGTGKVSNLKEFQHQVEEDLVEAIEANFKPADLGNLPPHKLQNIPFENAIKEKARTFLGRVQLLEKCTQFCTKGFENDRCSYEVLPHSEEYDTCKDISGERGQEKGKSCDTTQAQTEEDPLDVKEIMQKWKDAEKSDINRRENNNDTLKLGKSMKHSLDELQLSNEGMNMREGSTKSIKRVAKIDEEELNSNLLIIHGLPGCGKSALSAKVSMKCIEDLRSKGHFVFVHAVDSCPKSDDLRSMLRRLHLNLTSFHEGNDKAGHKSHNNHNENESESKSESENESESKTLSDPKNNHIKQLENIACQHPDRLFVVIVDAVNQFAAHFQAHTMWWVKLRNPPQNLRIVISTLEKENKTFENAKKMVPNALKIPVPNMTVGDAKKIVTRILDRYNKKLTTKNNKRLGNQLMDLIEKNRSPLYLTTVTHVLRMFGVYEQLSDYIQCLPRTVLDLFNFLLDGWQVEYGTEFVRDVFSIICVSRDGILENTLIGVLSFVEENEKIVYDCTFSRIYDSLREFLAGGGSGNMRFFHGQLKKVVRKRFMNTDSDEHRIHSLLSDYYVSEILSKLCEKPKEDAPPHFNDCLAQVVHHEVSTMTLKNAGVNACDFFLNSLRNVYYVRERALAGQQDALLQEYNHAIQQCKGDESKEIRKKLRDWMRFSINYLPFILQYQSSLSLYDTCMQQCDTSNIFKDSQKQLEKLNYQDNKLIWKNPSSEEEDNSVLLTYNKKQCFSCSVGVVDGVRLVCVGGFGKAWLYEMSSGVMLHEVAKQKLVKSTHISPTSKTFWSGDDDSYISVFSIDTGELICNEYVGVDGKKEDPVHFICDVGDGKVVCGTSMGKITILAFNGFELRELHSWSTGGEYYDNWYNNCYAYQSVRNVVLSVCQGFARVWNMSGDLVKEAYVGELVHCLSAHPVDADAVAVGAGSTWEDWKDILVYNLSTEEVVLRIRGVHGTVVKYNNSGDKIITLTKDQKTLLMYDVDGNSDGRAYTLDQMTSDISLVPGTNDLVAFGDDGCELVELSESSEMNNGEVINSTNEGGFSRCDDVLSCGVLIGGVEFFTLADEGFLEIWDVGTLQLLRRNLLRIGGYWDEIYEIGEGFLAVSHPTQQLLVAWAYNKPISWLVDTTHLTIVSTQLHDSPILNIAVSPLGNKCVVTCDDACHVMDITIEGQPTITNPSEEPSADVKTPEKKCPLTHSDVKYDTEQGKIKCCDMHTDGVMVVSGGERCGVHLWDINTGEKINILVEGKLVRQVKFVQKGVIYRDDGGTHLITLDGTHIWTVNTGLFLSISNEQYLITDGKDHAICVWSTETGKNLVTLADHRISTQLTCFLELPSCLLAYGLDGRVYKFELFIKDKDECHTVQTDC